MGEGRTMQGAIVESNAGAVAEGTRRAAVGGGFLVTFERPQNGRIAVLDADSARRVAGMDTRHQK